MYQTIYFVNFCQEIGRNTTESYLKWQLQSKFSIEREIHVEPKLAMKKSLQRHTYGQMT